MTRILILDDNHEIVSLLRMILEQRGFMVLAGRNGQEGLDVLGQSPVKPDLIFSNLRMPTMDGFTFLDEVRSQVEWAAIPVVMITALSSPEYREQAFAHGANDFVAKPFRLDDITASLKRLGIQPN